MEGLTSEDTDVCGIPFRTDVNNNTCGVTPLLIIIIIIIILFALYYLTGIISASVKVTNEFGYVDTALLCKSITVDSGDILVP